MKRPRSTLYPGIRRMEPVLLLTAVVLLSAQWMAMPARLLVSAVCGGHLTVGMAYALLVGSQRLSLERNGVRRRRWFGEKMLKYDRICGAWWENGILQIQAGGEQWRIPLAGAMWIGEDGRRLVCSFYYVRGKMQPAERKLARAFLKALANRVGNMQMIETRKKIEIQRRKTG